MRSIWQKKLAQIPGVTVDLESVQINMVFVTFDWPDLTELQPWLKERGVVIGGYIGPGVRFVTHNGITKEDVERLVTLQKEFHSC